MSIEDVIDARVRIAVREEVRGVMREVLDQLKASATDDFLDVEAASHIVGVHPETLRGWVKQGKLPRRKAGRELRFKREELVELMKRDTGPADSPEAIAESILNRKRGG